MKEEIVRLLNDVALELLKHENEDATNLLDKIDRVLRPVHASMTTGLLQVSDFVPEFIDKLREQLEADHNRWGNTWLNRPKKGQELRTKARYTDYFDMFEQAGTPVPWMKVIGGALICWIREQHPELCVDDNECIDPTSPDGKAAKEFGKAVDDIVNEVVAKDMLEEPTIAIDVFKNLVPIDTEEAREDIRILSGGWYGLNSLAHSQQCREVKVGDRVQFLTVKVLQEGPLRTDLANDVHIIEALVVEAVGIPPSIKTN